MEDYIQQILRDSGIDDSMDHDVRAQLTKDLLSGVSDLINKRIIESMSNETAEAFDKLLDENPDDLEAMQSFVDQNVPNRDQIIAATLVEFRTLYLGDKA